MEISELFIETSVESRRDERQKTKPYDSMTWLSKEKLEINDAIWFETDDEDCVNSLYFNIILHLPFVKYWYRSCSSVVSGKSANVD